MNRLARQYFEAQMKSNRQRLEDDAKEFHRFIGSALQNAGTTLVTRSELKRMFRDFCNETGVYPGSERMQFSAYLTVIVNIVGGLKGRVYSELEFCPWPPELTPEQLLEFYLAERDQVERYLEINSRSSTEEYGSLARTLLNGRNGKVMKKAMNAYKFDVEFSLTPDSCGYIDFGTVSRSSGPVSSAVITIHNKSDEHPVTFLSGVVTNTSGAFQLEDEGDVTTTEEGRITIDHGGSYDVTLKFKPILAMTYATQVCLELVDSRSGRKFDISCYTRGTATNSSVGYLTEEKYERKKALPRPRGHVLTYLGIKPRRPRSGLQLCALGDYKIPRCLQQNVSSGQPTGYFKALLRRSLSPDTYEDRFDSLLWAEERQMHIDIKKYNREESMEMVERNLLKLRVHGLAENRPSLVRGDHVEIYMAGKKYTGYVHDVEFEDVKLSFHRSFQDMFIPGQRYYICFSFHRVPMKVQHRAISSFRQVPLDILFPQRILPNLGIARLPDLRFLDRDVERNSKQKQAVENIVSGSSLPAPYLVFGPPGTGKTKTTVEAIKQVLKNLGRSKVLACTPSNSAADLVCEKLCDHFPSQVFRMNAEGRNKLGVSEKITRVSSYDRDTRSFSFPDKSTLMNYRVIVCTLVTAGRIVSADFPKEYFTHIFIDEAGYATEPESLIPIAGLMTTKSQQLVLAGDPKQLGPVLRSAIALTNGLQKSFLERLMETCVMYKRRDDEPHFDSRVVTKLVNNYRSHPDILSVPNQLFYNNELQPRANNELRESLCNWQHLPQRGFPIIFDDVVGKERTRKDSPSIYNNEEIDRVIHWVTLLYQAQAIRVRPEDIGIISPYRKQVQELRIRLRNMRNTDGTLRRDSNNIKVGTVEEFQGQERLVIIVTTVRSDPDGLKDDFYFKLGFVKNPKRFNVAITRAKALLIVVGNPLILNCDKSWNRFLNFVHENGGFSGNTDFQPTAPNDIFSSDEDEEMPHDASNEDEASSFARQNNPSWGDNDRI